MALEFDSSIVADLKATYKAMEEKGELLSSEKLTKYYSTFRTHFGPDRLKALNGESLLETMHSHGNKDSLVYWLEFKDDDEFPAPEFGSISGGSAHKFGLFRKRESGKWVTGAPQNEQELTLEQAIEKATQHRDQLLKGAELLDKLPSSGTDEDYERLQEAMNQVAPDVSNLAWGHKYLYLMSPEKLCIPWPARKDFRECNGPGLSSRAL
jgi:5-methylcytosine-specific restriction protein B